MRGLQDKQLLLKANSEVFDDISGFDFPWNRWCKPRGKLWKGRMVAVRSWIKEEKARTIQLVRVPGRTDNNQFISWT